MRKILMVVALMMVFSSPALGAGAVNWHTLKDGSEKAKTENKPMIVDFFFGKGCPRCEDLEKKVYNDPAIAKKINSDFVPVMVDLTKKLTKEEEELGNKYDFKSDCLLLFLDSSGNIVKDPSGKRLCFMEAVDPDIFVQYLDMVKKRISAK